MALVTCPECGNERVSDTAIACPTCGYNIKKHFSKLKADTRKQSKTIKRNVCSRKSNCPNCGKTILDECFYCPTCNYPINSEAIKDLECKINNHFTDRFYDMLAMLKSFFSKKVIISSVGAICLFIVSVIVVVYWQTHPTDNNIQNDIKGNVYSASTDNPNASFATMTPDNNSGTYFAQTTIQPTPKKEKLTNQKVVGYWYSYEADTENNSSVMYFTADGLFFSKTWRKIEAGTYSINGSSIEVEYDSYYNYAGSPVNEYYDSGSYTLDFDGERIIGYKYLSNDNKNINISNQTIKDYVNTCATTAQVALWDPENTLSDFGLHMILSVGGDKEPYVSYNNTFTRTEDISGDAIPELFVVGLTDDGVIGYIEIYKIEHGVIFRIASESCLAAKGGLAYPIELFGNYYLCAESISSSTGFNKIVYTYRNHEWVEAYVSKIKYVDGSSKIEGYLLNNQFVSENEYNNFNKLIENGKLTLSGFTEAIPRS